MFSLKVSGAAFETKSYAITTTGVQMDTSFVQNVGIGTLIPYFVSNSYFLSGSKDSLAGINNEQKPYLAKLNSDLDTVWTFHLTSIPGYGAFSQVIRVDNHLYVSGSFDPNGQGLNYKGFLLKLDTNGNQIWRSNYLATSGTDLFHSITFLNNRLYIAGGSNSGGNGDFDVYLMKVDTSGNKIWEEWWGSPFSESGWCTSMKDTNILLYGGINNAVGNVSNYLIKVDTTGGTVWEEVFNFNSNGSDESIKAHHLNSGDIIVAGHTQDSQNSGDRMGLLYKIDTARNIVWTRKYNVRSNDHYFSDMILTSDNGFAMVGYLFPDSPYNQDVWIVKVDSMGCDIPLCYLGERELGLDVPVLKSYPNPTSTSSTIELPKDSKVLQLFNVNGQRIVSYNIGNNSSSFNIDLSSFENGIYILKLISKDNRIIGQGKLIKK